MKSEPLIERRGVPHRAVEVRATGQRRIGGYAAVFNRNSENLGGFIERVAPGALNKSRGDGWPGVVCRYNHKDDFLLGSIAGGTLQLEIDKQGLLYDVELPQSRDDVLESVTRGDVNSSSFAFQCHEDEWRAGPGGYPQRILVGIRLIDVAPVVTPAYPDATVGLRSLAAHMDADIDDVVALARADELRRFFTRTDIPSHKPGTNPKNLLKLLEIHARRWPVEPPLTGRQALSDIMGKRW